MNNSEVSSYLLGHILLFWKDTMQAFQKNSKFSINSCFEKKFSGKSLCTRGAAGNWAVDLFSTIYFGEIIIFVVSKDQTFRIRCTLMNPEQFLILVPYLIFMFLSICLIVVIYIYFIFTLRTSCNLQILKFSMIGDEENSFLIEN